MWITYINKKSDQIILSSNHLSTEILKGSRRQIICLEFDMCRIRYKTSTPRQKNDAYHAFRSIPLTCHWLIDRFCRVSWNLEIFILRMHHQVTPLHKFIVVFKILIVQHIILTVTCTLRLIDTLYMFKINFLNGRTFH